MRILDLYDRTIVLLKIIAHKSSKHSEEANQIISELSNMKAWLYPDLYTEDVEKVTRCKNCKSYKKYKKKNALKATAFYACSKDKQRRDPEFFCKDGDPR